MSREEFVKLFDLMSGAVSIDAEETNGHIVLRVQFYPTDHIQTIGLLIDLPGWVFDKVERIK